MSSKVSELVECFVAVCEELQFIDIILIFIY